MVLPFIFVEGYRAALQGAAFGVMPSLYEPFGMANEFYGFFAFSGKLSAFIGPSMLALVTDVSESQRAGMAVVIVLFAVGLLLLLGVREPRTGQSLE